MKIFRNSPKMRGIKRQNRYPAKYPSGNPLIYKVFKANSFIEFVERAVHVSKTMKGGGD